MNAFSQGQGTLKGKIRDNKGEAIPFVNVRIYSKGNMVLGTVGDLEGNYTAKPLSPGVYNIMYTAVGVDTALIKGVSIQADQTSFQDVKMGTGAVTLKVFEVGAKLVQKDQTQIKTTMSREEIKSLPGRSAADVAKTVGGIYSQDDGQGKLNSRGGRDDANYYYIDGVKIKGSSTLPKAALEQVSVVTGGMPAQYGDVTGAIISITTRGAAREYSGGIDYQTSGAKFGSKVYGLDAMGYNLLEFNATGPLLWKKDETGKKTDPLIGFFIAGNATHIVDPLPSATGMWKVKDEKQAELNENPFRYSSTGTSTFLNAEYLRLNDLEKIKTRLNVVSQGINLNTKLDFNLNKTTTLTLGGASDNTKRNDDRYRSNSSEASARGNLLAYTLMNYDHNPQVLDNSYRVYARLTQRFLNDPSAAEGSAVIKNAYYTLQVDYQNTTQKNWDENLKDNLFAYGYYGKYKTYQTRDYAFGTDSVTGVQGLLQTTFKDTLVTFTPDYTYNRNGVKMVESYYKLFGWEGFDSEGRPKYDATKAGENLRNLSNVSLGGGLRNGDAPRDVYDMWRTSALVNNNMYKEQTEQYRLTAMGSADIKDHAIMLGFEYEQRVERTFNVGDPAGLWTLGRQLVNRHISNLDKLHPHIIQVSTYPLINYDRLNGSPDSLWGGGFNGANPQSYFDYNLRKKLELNPDGVDYIDFDSYGPETYSLGMFSPDELLNNGNAKVDVRGYDYTGKKITNYSTDWVNKFFTDKDALGNYVRAIAPYRPIYVAGYIQDKFAFDDLIFNVGVRVDRFDANQQILVDPWVLFPTVKAGEDLSKYVSDLGNYKKPANVGDDYVVYVDNVKSPTAVTGYRNGNTWYNAAGTEIQDASVLEGSSGKVSPLLVDRQKTNSQDIGASSFKDYRPRTAVMPRISFSFPVSDEALFFAHYDVLTKRPTTGNQINLVDYFYLNSIQSNLVNNPDLGLEQTIDYEVGFQQSLSKTSALTITSFYRENRNNVQVYNLQQAYPNGYISFANIDFGTVKGFTFKYELKATDNLRARISYTLQFADGTGSNAQGGLNLARSGKPNLRTLIPLSFDQRHAVIANIDYRYGDGKSYNGPVLFGKRILENMGANAVFNLGSGTPYSQQKLPTATGLISGAGASALQGQLNGARNPWQFVVNLGVDKNFNLKWGKKEGSTDAKKVTPFGIYLQIENLLNTLNIASVYRATGNPNDDGYLTAAQFQNVIESQIDPVSFRQLYLLKVNNGSNYTLPRRMKIGFRLDF